MGSLKTYAHLAGMGRMPTDYEIATSDLLYYLKRGFEVAVPLSGWYRRHQAGSSLVCEDWERFRDPRETTYAAYVARGTASEEKIERAPAVRHELPAEWVATLGRLLPPALHLLHGLQMLSAYVGQMAPASRLTIVAALQAADQMRAVERLARRAVALPSGHDGQQRWQADPAWQPARRLIETMLVAYDWGEAFTALNVCAKPALDAFLWQGLRELAREQGDEPLEATFASIAEDAAWHLAWSQALVAVALDGNAANREVFGAWVAKWNGLVAEAVRALGTLAGPRGAAVAQVAVERANGWQRSIGAAAP